MKFLTVHVCPDAGKTKNPPLMILIEGNYNTPDAAEVALKEWKANFDATPKSEFKVLSEESFQKLIAYTREKEITKIISAPKWFDINTYSVIEEKIEEKK